MKSLVFLSRYVCLGDAAPIVGFDQLCGFHVQRAARAARAEDRAFYPAVCRCAPARTEPPSRSAKYCSCQMIFVFAQQLRLSVT